MATMAQSKINAYINLVKNGKTNHERGVALEDLVSYIFEHVPGISVTVRNRLNPQHSEEVDIAFFNDQHRLGFFFLPFSFIVECKSWVNPVGSIDVNWFDSKVQHRGSSFGVLVAVNGITGDAFDRTAAHDVVSRALSQRRQLVVVTLDDLAQLQSGKDLVTLMKRKLTELAAAGTLLP
jgi:hypothetical protein